MKPEMLATILPLVIIAVIFQFTPLMTRPGIFFGATVAPDFPRSRVGRRLLRSFRTQAAAWSLIAILVAVLIAPGNLIVASIVPLVALIAANALSYWMKFRAIHEHYGIRPPEIRQADLSPVETGARLIFWWWLPPWLAFAAAAVYLHMHWNELPQPYPVHFDLNGNPNGWASRDFWSVYGSLLIGALTTLLLLVFAWLIARTARRTVMRDVTVRMLQIVLYPLAFTCVVVALLPLWRAPAWLMPAVMLVTVACLIVWAYRKISSPAVQDRTPEPMSDSYWKAGMFYYNPDDPAVFVAKRVGIGYTMNFASVWSWIIVLGILLTAVVPLFLIHPK